MKRIIKRMLLVLLVISCVLSFAACISNQNKNEKDDDSSLSDEEKYKDRVPATIVMPEDKYNYDTGIAVIAKNSTAGLSADEISNYVQSFYSHTFASVEERFEYEKSNGYLNSATYNGFSIYVNKYTGAVYYTNEKNGKLLSSEIPSYYEQYHESARAGSGIVINYSKIGLDGVSYQLHSLIEAAERGQISTEFLKNGIRVNYTLGDTTSRYLLPMAMPADKFEELVLVPMLDHLANLMEEYCYDETGEYNIFVNPKYNVDDDKNSTNKQNLYYYGYLNLSVVRKYLQDAERKYMSIYPSVDDPARKNLASVKSDIMRLYAAGTNGYTLKNLAEYKEGTSPYETTVRDFYSNEKSEIYKTKEAIYVFNRNASNDVMDIASVLFAKYVPNYTYFDMLADEEYCGIEDDFISRPVFKCSIVYTLNADGSMNVRFPYDCVAYDERYYKLESVSILDNFGKTSISDTEDSKYNFAADGTVTVVKFD